MSLTSILNNAYSGLTASQAALRSISNNVANVNTPGYARERVNLEGVVAGGIGMGVRISSIDRITNQYLEAAVYGAAGDAGAYEAMDHYLGRLQGLLGEPGADTGLAERLSAINTAAINLTADAADPLRRRAFVDKVDAALGELKQLGNDVAQLRRDTESEVVASVERVNTLLTRIHELNGAVAAAKVRGESAAGIADQRGQALQELGTLIRLDVREQPNGSVQVSTASGITLVDQGVRQLTYAPPPGGAVHPSYPPIEVLAVDSVTGEQVKTGEVLNFANSGGKIGGLLDLRDRSLADAADSLGTLFTGLANALNSVHNNASSVPALAKLEGRETGLLSSDRLGFTGAAVFAVTDATGKIVARTRIDFSAMPPGATMGDMVAAINAGLGGAATASFVNGKLTISANATGNGVAVAGDPAAPATRAGVGFSQFFGLNDLIRTPGPGLVPSGFAAGDAHGFAGGQTVQLDLRDAQGRPVVSHLLTMTAGGSFGDLVANLNASPLGSKGSFSLDSKGELRFTPAPGQPELSLGVVSDSTERGTTGASFSELFGIGRGYAAEMLNGASIRTDIKADAGRLSLAQLNTAATPGEQGLSPGDLRGATALKDALAGPMDFGGAGRMELDSFAARLIGRFGAEAARVEEGLADASARRDEAVQRRDDYSGVNIDEELSQMIVFQNSYSAAARLMTTAREMYDVLLSIGG